MLRFVKSFTNTAETYAAVDEGTLGRPYVAYIEDEHRIDWNGYAPKPDYSKEYFTIEALSAGTLNVYHNTQTTQSGTLFYKVNNGEYWVAVPMSSTAEPSESITLSAGDKVIFKGTLEKSNSLFSNVTLPINVYGNIQSLYFEDAFSGETTCMLARGMFTDCAGLVDASNLVLPATTLAPHCYENMFLDCTSLTAAPALPVTTLTQSCYYGMFINCTGLTSAPELPATTLAPHCYEYMFLDCTSLTAAPELPATNLAESCYSSMFQNCTSLTTAPVLPVTTLTRYCYYGMFQGCSSLNQITCLATDISAKFCTTSWVDGVSSTGTFTKAASMSSWTTGSNGIPENWTVVDAS